MEIQEPDRNTAEPDVKVPCEVYSRVVGYLRPVQAWNEGKQQEYADRKPFQMPATDEVEPSA
jgi:ribonucleoside-triphosphate reductase